MASLIIKDYHKFDYNILVKDYGFERIVSKLDIPEQEGKNYERDII